MSGVDTRRLAQAAIAVGAGLIVWQLLSSRAERRPRYGLVVWKKSQLPVGWADVISRQGWDFVSVKVLDGRALFEPDDAWAVVSELRRRGLALDGWGYHYCRTEAEATLEGQAAAMVCRRYGLGGYHWNAEAPHWGTGTNPAAAAVAFARAFKQLAPDVLLWANACSGSCPSAMTPWAISHFDVWEPMLYGTRPETIARLFDERLNRFGKDRLRAAMVGTGREDEAGRVWGFFSDRQGAPGLLSLVKREQPYALSFFRAPFLLLAKNQHNPSLAEQLRLLKAHTSKDDAYRRVA